jgi:LuxR family maltose regulon positive regulatory protein
MAAARSSLSTSAWPGGVPLLQGKVVVPPLPGRLLRRARLFAALDAGAARGVTLLVAPPGWGKSSLLCSWLHQPDDSRAVAWVSLGRGDDDPVRFWTYVLAALRFGCALPDDHPLATLRPPQDVGRDMDVFLPLLVNALGDLPKPVVLVLDDVHVLADEGALGGLSFLMLHAPRQLRLVLAGLYPPALPIARMRLAGELAEVTPDDLAFTLEETRELFDDEDLALTHGDLAVLQAKTEGWPAGVRLASLSMRGTDDPSVVVAAFAGTDRTVSDYLISEVFSRQSPDVQEFLLRTAVCERLTADLANELTDGETGGEMLELLVRTNVLTVALGTRPASYRYHPLFAEMLHNRLHQREPRLAAELHRSAARWLESRSLFVQALDHLVELEDWDEAGRVLGACWLPLYLDGELAALRSELERFPSHVVTRDPEIIAIRAVSRVTDGDLDGAAPDIASAQLGAEALEPMRGSRQAIAICVAQLERARLVGDLPAARSAAEVLLAADCETPQAGVRRDELQAVTLLHLGVTEYWSDEREEAEQHLRRGLDLARRSGRDYVALGCLSQLAGVITAQDRPVDALPIAQEAVRLAERRGWSQTGQAAEAWHALGWVHTLWNHLEAADQCLDRAEDAVRTSESAIHGTIWMIQGLVRSLRGDAAAALAAMEAAAGLVARVTGPHVFEWYIHAERVRLLLAVDRVDEARALVEVLQAHTPHPAHLLVAMAELELHEGRAQAAIDTLAAGRDGTAAGFLDQRVQAWALTAVALDRLDQHDAADSVAATAVRLAAPQRMRQPFLRFGAPMRGILARQLVVAKGDLRFVESLLPPPVSELRHAGQLGGHGNDQLTTREVEVVRRLASLLTVPEIAAELFVSVNTVKAHLKSIYRKLGATSRRQAVERATGIGLIDASARDGITRIG